VIRRCVVAAILLLAGGCATLPPPADGEDWPARRAALQALDRWSLDGRIAVAAGADGFTGGFAWEQAGSRADIVLSGPVGGSALNLRIEGGEAVVAPDHGADATALLERYFGVNRPLPAAEMRYWLIGAPAPHAPAEETLGADRRLATLAQAGWRVRFDRYDTVGTLALPSVMEMTTEGLRLRIKVSGWELTP
jgi:outer membrane lipoprotein LolB